MSMYNCGLLLSVVLTVLLGRVTGPIGNLDLLGVVHAMSVADVVWAFAYDFGGRFISWTMVSSMARSCEALSMMVYDGSEGLTGVDIPDTDVGVEPGHAADNRRLMPDMLEYGVDDRGENP